MKHFSGAGDKFRKEREKKKRWKKGAKRFERERRGWGGGVGWGSSYRRNENRHVTLRSSAETIIPFFLSEAELSPDRLSNCRGALWVALTNTLEASPRNIHLAPSASLIYPADSLITLPRGATGRSVLLRACPYVHKWMCSRWAARSFRQLISQRHS